MMLLPCVNNDWVPSPLHQEDISHFFNEEALIRRCSWNPQWKQKCQPVMYGG